ncbi:arylsulfatase [Lutimonas saemankumensis]|uniref:arylsulfatase n=1 Tax=Lutimonas saemankumensis TaxID=483016 RepID=UPI001CD78F1D|nr:arylsulfatase [Lutimonas saemankumensis]MCA0931272.1 arylsulfatase [Lutimonas saemankumensis]
MYKYFIMILLGVSLLWSCNTSFKQDDQDSNFAQYGQEFKGKIAESYEDSKEWWPEKKRPPSDAPNVIIFLLDDVGFAQVESFGGLIETPNIDALAENGLRFNNFHTTALCSPSRASLMAGRNPHKIGLGSHALTAMGFPGYNAIVPPSAKSVANYLQEEGYVNYALGKWDHTPLYEVSQVGPFDRWPSDEGFDHGYNFMAADVHQFIPVMWDDHHPEPYRKSEHLDKDLADRAIEWITGHKSLDKDLPFMMLWASGSMHSPHHAPDEYIAKYKGKFDMGWDKAREQILAKQIELGIAPENTNLSKRIEEIPAWDSLTDEERKLYAKQMEVFAGQMEHVDFQIGRVVETLKRIGELDNTLIFVTADNGASGEGGLQGTFNETYVLNGLQTPFEANMRHYDNWGQWDSYPHYHAGWAMAGNTPFPYFKQSEHRGGQQDALVVHWPAGIKAKGEIRNQYHHITDIAPTIMEAVGAELPEEYHGIPQQDFTGIPMNYAFDNPNASNAKKVQYYEMFGNRAIWADGWKAVTLHANRMPWDINRRAPFEEDVWELYNVEEDFSESNDLAAEYPEKLEELKKLFEEEAWDNNVYPMYDDMLARLNAVNYVLFGDKKEFTYYAPGATRIAEKASAPVKGRSHTIETTLELDGSEEGVIVACGGMTGGYTMYIKDGKLRYNYNFLDGVHHQLESKTLPKGKVTLKFEFILDRSKLEGGKIIPWPGTGALFVNGEKQDEVYFETTHISTYSLAETFDLGMDTGTQVDPRYEGNPFKFTGELDRVVITLKD